MDLDWCILSIRMPLTDFCQKRKTLQGLFAEVTVQFTAALQSQMQAVIDGDLDAIKLWEQRIADAAGHRKEVRDRLFDHIAEHGC